LKTALRFVPVWRHNGANGQGSRKHQNSAPHELPAEVFARVDHACALRPGSVSRNTRIAGAIQEKATRESKSGGWLPKASWARASKAENRRHREQATGVLATEERQHA
jgi:hypothetical protein